MNKLFTSIAVASLSLTMAVGVGVALGSERKEAVKTSAAEVTAVSFSRSGTTDTVTNGYDLVKTNCKTGTGYYQDKDSSTGLDFGAKKSSGTIWTTSPTSISLTAKIGGGTTRDPLNNSVIAFFLDSSGNTISASQTTVTTKVETTTGQSYTVTMPSTDNVAGVLIHHTKESGYNVRLYSFSLKYDNGSSTSYTVTYDSNGGTGTMNPSTGASIDLPACTFTAPTNKEFLEWNTSADGTGTSYAPGTSVSQDLDLFAIWYDPYAFSGNSLVFADQKLKDTVSYSSRPFKSEVFNIQFAGGGNDGKYYNTGSGIRTYGNGTVTLSSSAFITSVTFVWDSTNKPTSSTTLSSGAFDANFEVWTGSTKNLVLTREDGSGHWRMKSVTVVTSGAMEITDAITAGGPYSVIKGTSTLELYAQNAGETGYYLDGLTWSSSDTGVFTVDGHDNYCFITGVEVGTATLTVSKTGYQNATAVISVTTNASLDFVILSGTPKTSYVDGESWSHEGLTLTAIYTDESESDVTELATWSFTVGGNPSSTASYGDTSYVIIGTYEEQSDNLTVTNVVVTYAKGSEHNPYTVAEAIAAIDVGGDLTNKHTLGIICQVDSYDSNHKSITYWISDDGTSTTKLEVYSGKGLNGADFSAQTDIEVGASVQVCGTLKKYNSTYEYDYNNYQISYTPSSVSLVSITGLEGSLTVDSGAASWDLSQLTPKGKLSTSESVVDISDYVTLSTSSTPGSAGTTTISVTVTPTSGSVQAESFDVSATVFAPFDKNSGEYHIAAQSDIAIGNHIIIAAGAHDYVMGSQSGNNCPAGEGVKDSTKGIVSKTNAQDIEIVAGATSGTFAMKVATDTYLAATGGTSSNYLKTQSTIDAKSSFTFTKVSDTNWTIVASFSGRNTLRFNNSSNPKVFSCYGSGQADVTVYSFVTYQSEADAYATQFNAANICGADQKSVADSTKWLAQKDNFDVLTSGAQALLTNATGTGQNIADCIDLYDRVLTKRADRTLYPDFMGRNIQFQGLVNNSLFNSMNSETTITIVVVVALTSVTAIGAIFFIKRRKYN